MSRGAALSAPVRVMGRAISRLGLRASRTDKDLRHEIAALLAQSGSAAKIASLATPGRNRTSPVPRSSNVELIQIPADLSPQQLHLAFATVGNFDLIVVDTPVRRWPRLLEHLVFHLRPGGALIFRGLPGKTARPLLRHLRALDQIRTSEQLPSKDRRGEDLHALALAIKEWRVVGAHIVISYQGSAFAKLRHSDIDDLLPGPRLPQGTLVARIDDAKFTARCQIRQNHSEIRKAEQRSIAAPSVSLRSYHDVLCLPRQVVLQESLVLPDSYRRSHKSRHSHSVLVEIAPRFAGLRTPACEPRNLEGTFVYLDSEFQGHYGHLVTEQLSRMWAWPQIQQLESRPRILMSSLTQRDTLYPHERDLLGAFDILEEDVTLFTDPVRVERLLSAAPMFSQPGFVHPAIAEVWSHAGEALAKRSSRSDYPTRIFCARRTKKRECRNAQEVETLFLEFGFAIIYAEDYTLAEQAAMFRHAKVVAGYAGAAMFNLCYADVPKDVVMLVSESYTAQNEYMIAAVHGHRLTLVWCPSDIPMPTDRFSAEAYQSSFVFDTDRDGEWLRVQLAGLP